jgi:acetolactate synthase-1/3 small subunit
MRFQLTLSLENEPGVLDRALAVFSRRRIRIDHLLVSTESPPDKARAVIGFETDGWDAAERLRQQVARGIQVMHTEVQAWEADIRRELALVRVRCRRQDRRQMLSVAACFGAQAVAVTADGVVFSLAAETETVEAFLEAMGDWSIEDSIRTGTALLARGSPRAVSERAPRAAVQGAPAAHPNHPVHSSHPEEEPKWPPSTMTVMPSPR